MTAVEALPVQIFYSILHLVYKNQDKRRVCMDTTGHQYLTMIY